MNPLILNLKWSLLNCLGCVCTSVQITALVNSRSMSMLLSLDGLSSGFYMHRAVRQVST